ncbi:chitin synthase chs-2-like isoform X3 [Ostrea edulis]|uniref:chitin synthase chs-2-like isoform X3 n=1 Tax=Ostrea edulis TaxID=37623 RepID=UPI0024AEBA66|nr:chitin synthase chs-2-like isoform X3 [Ostrea edulis]
MASSDEDMDGNRTLPGQVKSQSNRLEKNHGDTKPSSPERNPDDKSKSDEDDEWDCAEETPMHGANDDDDSCWEMATKVGLVVCGILLFIVVFWSACLSRIIIHIMIWKLNPPYTNNNFTLNRLGGTLMQQLQRMRLDICDGFTPDDCTKGQVVRGGLPESWVCRNETAVTCLLWEEIPSVNVGWIWGLLIIMSVPYIYTMIVSLWRICFKKNKVDDFNLKMFFVSLTVELIHSTGLCILVFVVMPAFDPASASILPYFVCVIPILLSVKFQVKRDEKTKVKKKRKRHTKSKENGTKMIEVEEAPKPKIRRNDFRYQEVPFLGVIVFVAALIFLCVYVFFCSESNFVTTLVLLLISVIMVSVVWWENFVTSNLTQTSDGEKQKQSFLKNYVKSKREKVSALTYLIKIGWIFLVTLIIYVIQSKGSTLETARAFLYLDKEATVQTLSGTIRLESRSYITYGCMTSNPYFMALICFILTFVFFKAARYACRVVLQRRCFAPPIGLNLLLMPFVFVILMKYPLSFTTEGCNVLQPLWELDYTNSLERLWPLIVSGVLGLVSVAILTLYVWTTKGSKMDKVERLFMKPAYCGLFPDLSLLLSRRRIVDDSDYSTKKVVILNPNEEDKPKEVYSPMVYFCATMWHETENEMTQLLKSIFRVDVDQCWKRNKQAWKQEQKRGYYDEEIYEFEVHVFFDDAFKPRKVNGKSKKGRFVNEFVKLLEHCVPETAKSIYGNYELAPVEKFATPYGMKYVWNLLTEDAKLIVHLKDKFRIRHRKRWSQVMYMYYLLSFELNKLKPKLQDSCNAQSKNLKEMIHNLAQNTFLLALDGDVDFKPEAVTLLLDRMKKNADVGAACGRIHPIGSGPMVWYQKFEYAVSHWLQKATEHVIGCVLCSPGCFSLFRGSAVLADNVMKTYTRQATEATHHIQYDQGEDRWLCTLMLKEGFRVEYCAASDALTFAPEGFFEFYKQRRRWAPSTMANILDLLLDWKYVKKNNDSISMLYIIYHIFLFVSSILTPGTIFLLILGAIITAFPTIEPWLALILNMTPVAILIISIFLAKEDTQLLLAGIISTIYSLVMMVVLIGLVKEGVESKFCSVTTVFFCFVAGVFVIAALIHPQEFTCIFHGLLYFLAVPSMSMLLILYSIGNMHNINWGTRENKSAAVQDTVIKKKNKLEGQTCSFGDWCRCMVCVREIHEPEQEKGTIQRPELVPNKGKPDGMKIEEKTAKDNAVAKVAEKTGDRRKRGDFKNCEDIPDEEEKFWTGLIKKYLKPIDIKSDEQQRIQEELLELRNKIFFFVFIVNTLFVTIVYVLTQVNSYQGTLEIPLPCNVAGGKQGKIEPISIAFTLTFGILLLIQFFGMIYHRVSTLTHIISSTRLGKQVQIKRPTFEGEREKAERITGEERGKDTTEGKLAETTKGGGRGWSKVRAGVLMSASLMSISGEKRNKPVPLTDLKNVIKEKTKPLDSVVEEQDDELLSKYSNIPVIIQSVRGLSNIKIRKKTDKQGTSTE